MSRVLLASLLFGALWSAPTAGAKAPPHVDVVEISGLIDERVVDFAVGRIQASTAQAVLIRLDSRGAVTDKVTELVELVADPPVPVAVWVGPAPAQAFGAAVHLVAAAEVGAAAPGSRIGLAEPYVTGSSREPAFPLPSTLEELDTGVVEVGDPFPPLIDVVTPSVGQMVVALDGLPTSDGVLETAREVVGDDGITRLEPVAETRFHEPGLLTKTLRVAASPNSVFLFLVTGLALAAFEFYAAGVGLMAAVAALSLGLSGYGLATLPIRPWAVALAVVGIVAYLADFQLNDLGWRSLVGTASLVIGGLWLVDGDPHFTTAWWAVVLVVLGAALFFGVGMTAVVRARFSTTTIGREHLVGRRGVIVERLDPVGAVDLDGARWPARAPRAFRGDVGAPVKVVGIDGLVLQVEADAD